MAWNGSDKKVESHSSTSTSTSTSSFSFNYKALFAGLIVVCGAVAVSLLFWPKDRDASELNEKAPQASSKRISAATPAKPSTDNEQKAPKKLPPQAVGELRDGYRLLPNGKLSKVTKSIDCDLSSPSLAEKIFDQPADQEIAELLLIAPGDEIVGDDSGFYDHFNDDFKKAIKQEIKISDDDDAETKLLKESVIATRTELKQRMDAGEDVAAVMKESRKQMQELQLYRDELEEQVQTILKEKKELTNKDLEDLVGAANKMLEERGAKPIDMTAAFVHQLRRQQLLDDKNNEKENSK